MASQGALNGDGLIFSIDTNGTRFKDVHDFNNTKGGYPVGSLIRSGTVLYGMTESGGLNNLGCVFSVDTNGSTYADIHDFLGPDGANPWGSLIQWGTSLYGMTWMGGANDSGCVFSIQTNGTGYTDIFDMTKPTGVFPYGDLVISGNELFGMNNAGGPDNIGTIFSVHTDGTSYTVLLNFNDVNNDEYPWGSLTLSGNTLYGMTSGYFPFLDYGSAFSIDTNGGNYLTLFNFNGFYPANYGAEPFGSLLLSNGVLYGMASQDGDITNDYNGVVFNYPLCPLLTATTSVNTPITCHGASDGSAMATVDGGPTPYTYSWSNGGTNVVSTNNPTGPILSAGSYTVTITDANGCVYVTSVNVRQPLVLTDPATTTSQVSCNGQSTGSMSTTVAGGTAPYTYAWSGGGNTSTKTGVSAGTYTISVTDNNGCLATATTIVTQPTPMVVTHDSVSQVGPCNGVAAITVTGGTPGYNYLWLTGNQTTDTIKAQCAGTYCVQVTDNNGCTETTCVTVKLATGEDNLNTSSGLKVYPDPNTGNFTIDGLTKGQQIEIYNSIGQNIACSLASDTTIRLDISNQPDGIYLIRILNKDGTLVSQTKMLKTQ